MWYELTNILSRYSWAKNTSVCDAVDELVAIFLMNHLFRKEKRRFYKYNYVIWTHDLPRHAFDPFLRLILYISSDFNVSLSYRKT